MLLVGAESRQKPETFVLSSEKDSDCMDDDALAISRRRNLERANASIEMEPAELLTPTEESSRLDPEGQLVSAEHASKPLEHCIRA